jgi:hypothetical protein
MNTLDLYLEFASAGRQGGKFLLQHPVLMSPPALAELLEWVKTLTGDEAANWARLLRPLMSTAERVNTEGYPLSEGPIEEIWGRRQAGEIDEAQALELARQAAPLMSLAYALALTRYSARLDRTRWPEAVGVQRLLVAAVEGALGPEAEAMRRGRTSSKSRAPRWWRLPTGACFARRKRSARRWSSGRGAPTSRSASRRCCSF